MTMLTDRSAPNQSPSTARARAWAWWRTGALSLLSDARRHRVLYTLLAAVWTLAAVRVFAYPIPVVPLVFNLTGSLPYHVGLVDSSKRALARGDYIVFAFSGEAGRSAYPGLRDQAFFKRVIGIAGDVVTVDGRRVFVNGVCAGTAKPQAFDRRPLEPIAPGVVPPGFLYVQGTSPDSFDSRYRISGLVPVGAVAGRVHPIF